MSNATLNGIGNIIFRFVKLPRVLTLTNYLTFYILTFTRKWSGLREVVIQGKVGILLSQGLKLVNV